MILVRCEKGKGDLYVGRFQMLKTLDRMSVEFPHLFPRYRSLELPRLPISLPTSGAIILLLEIIRKSSSLVSNSPRASELQHQLINF